MKVYIAGPLFTKGDQARLEKIDNLCKELNLDTFLPHRDVGVFEKGDSSKFFKKDRDMVDECDFLIALIDWKGISSGTAWEIGYAHARNTPVIGLVEDLDSAKKVDRICVMCFNSVILVDSFEKLKKEIINLTSSLTQ